MSQDPVAAQLVAEARHAATRLTLYRQRLYTGAVDGGRLRELEHQAELSAERLATHKARTAPKPGSLKAALADVTERLDAPGVERDERMKLLQRQAALGDLRDDLAQRARRQDSAAR